MAMNRHRIWGELDHYNHELSSSGGGSHLRGTSWCVAVGITLRTVNPKT